MPLGDFTSIYMPYCLKKQTDGSYAVLNREYKPVGFNTDEYINYLEYPVTTPFYGIGPGVAKQLSCHDSDNLNTIQLYNDESNPNHSATRMDVYLKKLRILARLKVKESI